jgi:hypothetical protein
MEVDACLELYFPVLAVSRVKERLRLSFGKLFRHGLQNESFQVLPGCRGLSSNLGFCLSRNFEIDGHKVAS